MGLTVDNVIVELDPQGPCGQAGGRLQRNDKILRVDG